MYTCNHQDEPRLPKVIVDVLEPALLFRQSSPPEDGLEVDPLALYLVKVVKVLIKVCEARLPNGRLILERLVVRRVLQ